MDPNAANNPGQGNTSGQGDKGQQAQSQTQTINFLDYTPEDIKSDPEAMKPLQQVKDLSSLIKNYVHAQKQMGKSLTVPGPDAKPEDWDAFYSKAGRPESPEKYEIKRLENFKVPYDEALEKKFLTAAHKSGLNKQQAQGLLDWWNAEQEAAYEQSQQETERSVSELKKEWGSAFDAKKALAQRAVKRFGDKSFVGFLDKTGLGNNPFFIRVFSRIGENIREDSAPSGDGSTFVGKEEAIAKIAEINNDRNHPYHNKTKPGHKEAVDEMQRLFAIAYG